MSQKRYFYTDPLAAAWMARYHAMTLYSGHLPDDYDAYSAVNWWHAIDDERFRREKFNQKEIRFYIIPDSLHLLQPQESDLILYAGGDWVAVVGLSIGAPKANEHLDHMGAKIIQRNGVAFHMPETEAA